MHDIGRHVWLSISFSCMAMASTVRSPGNRISTGCAKAEFLEGGSAIGEGVCVRKNGAPGAVTAHVTGFIRVKAANLHQAKSLLIGNPVFEAGGTVEIRELPRTE